MLKKFGFLFLLAIVAGSSFAQTREQLEKQRNDLRKELQETQELLKKNQSEQKENLLQWRLISKKVDLQDRVVENINKDIRVLDNNLYTIQKDINRYDRLLDTLRRDYAKSMVYAYKNRSSYDFLNFIFSAENFNDAIKRIAYLKSYRSYREMQGQNIIRMQELRKNRVAELNGTKEVKNKTLTEKNSELQNLEGQKKEQDNIVNELKKTGSNLNNQIAAKNRQMAKINATINAAIKKAQEQARKEALARKAAEEKARREELARQKAEDERLRMAANSSTAPSTVKTNAPKGSNPSVVGSDAGKNVSVGSVAAPTKPAAPVATNLNTSNAALNSSFERNRGGLPWPVDKGYLLMKFGNNKMPSGIDMINSGLTIACDIGAPVKAVFDGTVRLVTDIDGAPVVMLEHGDYFTAYINLSGISVHVGDQVKTGQVLGRVATNLDGVGAIDFNLYRGNNEQNPENWLRRR